MKTIRKGDKGIAVRSWENFLLGCGFYWLEVDGFFDDKLHEATVSFQQSKNLVADGVVGPKTYSAALLMGFPGIKDDSQEQDSPNWPSRPNDISSLSQSAREKIFGKFSFVPEPVKGNLEAIKITDGWSSKNIVSVEIPQIKNISGAPKNRIISIHTKIANQFISLWKTWEEQNLLHIVTDFGGTWVPRFIRGSRTTLSNHAWGTAFDINVSSNPLGATPALIGSKGSVRKLVPAALEHGFFWGGWFPNRPDGMHFEAYKIL